MKRNDPPAGKLFQTVWDERQQQAYQKANSKAFNLVWVLLLAAFLVQVVLYPREPARWLAEMGLFVLLSGYALYAYLKAGLWTGKKQQPNPRQNLVASLTASVLLTGISLIRMLLNGQWAAQQQAGSVWPALRFLLVQGLAVFAAAWGLLWLLSRYHRNKQQQEEARLEEDADERS